MTPVSLAGSHKYHRSACDPTPQQPRDHRPHIHVPSGGPLPSHPGSEYNPPLHLPTPACWLGPSTLLTLSEGEGGLYPSPLSLTFSKNYIGLGLQPAGCSGGAVEVGGLRRQKLFQCSLKFSLVLCRLITLCFCQVSGQADSSRD